VSEGWPHVGVTGVVTDADFRSGSITSFRAGDVDFRFTLDTGRFSASQRTVETGQGIKPLAR
jgi:hypothetical protein